MVKEKKESHMLGNMIGNSIEFNLEALGIDEILQEEIKPFGENGGHITIKGKHVGKKARVVIFRKEEGTDVSKTDTSK